MPAAKPRGSSCAERLNALVDDFASHPVSADLRERVRNQLPVLYELRAVGKALLPEDADLSGRDRVLKYLQRYLLTVIEGDELLLISWIGKTFDACLVLCEKWVNRKRELVIIPLRANRPAVDQRALREVQLSD